MADGDSRASRGRDPTGTLPLQRKFARDLDARWKKLRALIPDAIAAKTHAVNTISHAAATGDDPVRAFQRWVDEAMRQLVLGGIGAWTLSYVRRAADAGTLRAQQLAPSTRMQIDRTTALQTLCASELQGICDAVSQQATRAFGQGLLNKRPAGSIVNDVRRVIADVGVQRGHLLASFFVVRAHGAATLDVFRAAGLKRVGTVAETLRGTTGISDAKPKSKVKAKSKKKWADPEDLVQVLTAGDDDVCPVCEEISEAGPYTLDEAERLIPAHPRCRCAFVPAWDKRYARVGDAEWTEQLHPRDKDGKFAPKGTATVEEKIVAVKAKLNKLGMNVSHEVEMNDPDDATLGETHILSVKHEHTPAFEVAAGHVGLHIAGKMKGKTHTHYNVSGPTASKELLDPSMLHMSQLEKTSGKMGSNEGGVYSDVTTDKKYYVKQPQSKDHVQNELVAAKLYQLAGVKTLNYVPVAGGEHVATELETLGKKNVYDLSPAERETAKQDFAVHAWLANWDAVGTGGDNVGVRQNGDVVTLDTGGSLKYRAQGKSKGSAFGDTVPELQTLRDPAQAPDAAKLYGGMTDEQVLSSIARVTNLSNLDIAKAVYEVIPPASGGVDLTEKLIKRRNDLEAQADAIHQKIMAAPTSAPAPVAEPHQPVVFKTKMEHAKHLLLKGTTSAELKTALGWPSIGVPKVASDLGLKLTKTKLPGGAFHYKGEIADPAAEGIAAAKAELHAPDLQHLGALSKPGEDKIQSLVEAKTLAKAIKTTVSPDVEWHPAEGKSENYQDTHSFSVTDPKQFDKLKEFLDNGNYKYDTYGGGGENSKFYGVTVPVNYKVVPDKILAEQVKAAAVPEPSAFDPEPEQTPWMKSLEQIDTPPAPPAPKSSSYTQAELDKAKKTTALTAQYVPGAPQSSAEADALIAKFNEKWAGKTVTEQHLLEQKVDEFKQLAEQMKPIAAKAQAVQQSAAEKEAAAKANMIALAKAKQDAAIKKAADEAEALAALPEEEQRAYWLNKSTGDSGYLTQGKNIVGSNYSPSWIKESGMTPAEVGFIRAFTGPHSDVNEALRSGHMSEEALAFKAIMNEALAKAPKYTGDKVWRKIVLNKETQDKYVTGQIVHWPAFSSTAKNPNTWSGNTHFTILSPKSGVDVESISSNPSEAEVIMPADTYYKVVSKTPNQNTNGQYESGALHIVLQEVIPFGKKLKKAA